MNGFGTSICGYGKMPASPVTALAPASVGGASTISDSIWPEQPHVRSIVAAPFAGTRHSRTSPRSPTVQIRKTSPAAEARNWVWPGDSVPRGFSMQFAATNARRTMNGQSLRIANSIRPPPTSEQSSGTCGVVSVIAQPASAESKWPFKGGSSAANECVIGDERDFGAAWGGDASDEIMLERGQAQMTTRTAPKSTTTIDRVRRVMRT